MNECAMLDTSFLIRLLKSDDPLHENAKSYFKYFLEHDILLKVSTIALAEYCVKGDVSDLPIRNILFIPFNYNHALRAGKFISSASNNEMDKELAISPRMVIPNDSKMFAQADVEKDVKYFVSCDSKAKKVIDRISAKNKVSFSFIDINIPCNTRFSLLDM